MKAFTHINARSVEEVVATLAQYDGRARLNAGGTDLMGLLKDDYLAASPEAVVNIKTIPGLDYIREEGGLLRIGALAPLREVVNSPLVRERFPALAEAARAVASPQIRNHGTIGGNLCQDVRCCYFRYPRHLGGPIRCARKGKGACLAVTGDNRNHAIIGGRKCFAVCPSDTAVPLSAYDAQLIVAGPAGERRIPVSDFHTALGNRLENGEMVKEVEIPFLPGTPQQSFLKFALRRPVDFAVVSACAVITVDGGLCSEARIALGAVAPGVYRAAAAEKFLRGRVIDTGSAAEAGELALTAARALSQNGYKIEIAKTLVGRAILGLSLDDRPHLNVCAPNLHRADSPHGHSCRDC